MSKMASKKTTVKQKAFTLIELMAVVIILGIISTVAVSAINTSIKNSKEKLYVEQIGRLEKGVEKWAVDNTTRLPIDNSGIVFFSVDSLKDEGIVDSDSIVDPRTDEQLKGCVTIKYETAYEQYSYDYIDDDCSTVSNAYKPVISVVGGDNQFLEVNSIYEIPEAKASDYTGLDLKVSGPIIKKGGALITSIDSSTVGDVYTLTYMATDERLGLSQTKEITLTVNDTIAPVIVVNGSAVSASTTFEAAPIFVKPDATITDNSCGLSGTDITKNGCATTLDATISTTLAPQVPGTYNVTFRAEDSSGNTKFLIVSVTVVDTIAPAAPTFALKHNNSSGANYGETWTGTDVWVGNLAAVENGSGVAKYQYAVDCTGTWTDITTKTYNTETNEQICIKAIDNVGNESTPSRLITIRVDKTAPTCASSGGSTAWTNGSRVITGACSSDTGSGCNPSITVSQTYSSEINTTTAGPGSGLIQDNAGNTASCPANQTVRIDKTAPTCSASTGGNTAWTNGSRVISGTCSDTGGSGCSGTTISTTYSTEVNTTTASAGSGTFTDNAGNSASVTCPGTQTVRIDKTAPTCASSGSNTAWTNGSRTLTGTCSDLGGSGCLAATITQLFNTEINTTIASPGTVTDVAGNSTACPPTQTVRIDKTAPTCASSGSNTAWTNGSRTLTGTCSDTGGSGCTAATITQLFNTEINTTIASPGTVTDVAGNSTACPPTQTVRIDKTAPTCASSGGSTAWTNGSRTITGTCSDTGGSGCSGNSSTVYSSEINTTTAGPPSVVDNAGNPGSCPSNQTVRIDKTAPAIANGSSGAILYGDPNFASGTNSINIYNNSGNGTVTHSRVALATPEGSYALQITTSGSASPGHGGFYFATPTSASKVFFTRIVARIPAGYTINWASNAYGGGSVTWLTSQAGTGAWEEYLVRVNVGTDGNYSSTNFFYLTGGAAPVTWHVAYATVHDTTRWGTTNNITSTSTDSGSGITGYGTNQSSVTAPTYKTVTATSEVVPSFNGLTANGTHYIWVRDAAGNQSNMAVSVSYIDRTAPTCTSSGGDAAWTSGNRTLTGTCSDSQSGCTGNASTTHSASINTTTASPGTVYDNVGNSVACPANQTVRIDKTAPTTPTISLNGYTSGAWTNGNVTITASSTDAHSGVSSYEYSHDQVGVAAMANPWTITWGGQWTFYVRSVDAAGNRSGWSTGFVLRIDKTPPSGTITSPNSAGTWYTTDIPVTFTPSDDNGVSSWRINWANGGVWAGWGAYRYTANYSEPFTGEGVRQAQMEVTDIAGNVSYITSGTYYLDKSNPYTSFSSSYSSSTWYDSNISITMTPRDSVSGVNRYNYTFYNGGTAGTSYGYYYDATARSDVFDGDGIREMRSIVYDNAGRSGTSWSNEYWRDTVNPSLTPHCAYNPNTDQMRISFTDARSGMASADASAGGFGYTAGTNYAYRTTVFSGTTLNVTYRYARDRAGNETSSSTAVNCTVSYTY